MTTADVIAQLAALRAILTDQPTAGTDAPDDAAEERKAQREGVYDSEADQDWLAGRRAG